MSDDQGKLLDHEYDGIQELDNNLPTWWLWTFFITIIFGFIYWLHYDFSKSGPTLDQELAQGMMQVEQNRKKAAEKEDASGGVDEAKLIVNGQKIYKNYCASCHNVNGGGSVGPNLTDKYWIHGKGDKESMAKVIEDGVLEKGMPAWKQILKPNDVSSVVAFVMSLKETNVYGGKADQGALVE